MNARIPHLRIVVAVTAAAIFGYALVTGYVLIFTDDLVTQGGVIGTWQNVALLGFGFWLGSSSGGKAKDETPTPVTAENTPDKPVPTIKGPVPAIEGEVT